MDTVLLKTSGSTKYNMLVLQRVEEMSGLLDFARTSMTILEAHWQEKKILHC